MDWATIRQEMMQDRTLVVYRKGDIVVEPMNSRDVLPKNVPGVGWGGVGWGGVGWGWGGVGWVM